MQNNLKFNKEKMTLILEVKLDESILDNLNDEASKKGLNKKEEFHTTLIGYSTGQKIISIGRDNIDSIIENIYQEFKWQFSPKNEFYYIEKDYPENEKRRSIIQVIDLPELPVFYKKMNETLGTNFEIPFPHTTLFTNSTNEENRYKGIGIYSKEEFNLLKPIKI